MATSVAELAINITTSIAGLQVGLQQANSAVSGFAATAGRQIAQATDRINAFGAAFGKLAGLTIAGFGVNAFQNMIDGAIDAQAKLHDLAQSAGTTASELSSLIPASRLSGVSMETVASAAGKFSKNLIDVQAGTGKAAEAFKALGFSARDADEFLKRPTQGLFELARRMNEFRDDGYKTAAGMELLGKNFATLAPFMKELGEQSQLTARLTDEQAAAADRLQDQLALLALAADEAKQAFAQSLIPALSEVASNMLIAQQNGASFLQSLFYAGVDNSKTVQSITNLREEVNKTLEAMSLASQPSQNALFNSRFQQEEVDKLTEKLKGLEKQIKIIQQIRDADIFRNLEGQFTGDVRDRQAGNSAFPLVGKGSINFAPVADNAKASIDRIARELDKLEEKWRGIFTSRQVAIDPATVTALAELDKLLDAARISWDEYVAGLESALDADNQLAEEQKALTEAISQTYKILDDMADQALPDMAAALAKMDRPIESIRDGLQSQNEQLQRQIDVFGLSAEAAIQFVAAQERIKVAASDASATIKQEALDAIDLNEQLQLSALGQQRASEALHSVFDTLDSVARDAFDSIADKGANMWERIKESGKRILLDFLYQLTLKPFLITIAATLTGVSQPAAANVLGGGGQANPLSFLTGGGNSLLGSAGTFLFGEGSAGAAALGAGFSAGMETLSIAASAGVEAIGGFSAALGAFGAVAGPLIPLFALAIPLLGGLFSKDPSQVKGQFQISAGTTGFEDNTFTPSKFGNLGFSDAGTQYFSGQAAQVLNKIVGGALTAFEQRFSPEQTDRLTGILQGMTFPGLEGTFTTEDFIKQYGGDILQQVVTAAFEVLDPALAEVVKSFHGTADEIVTFSNTLLGIHDALTAANDANLTANATAALAGADQKTADKVLAFVNVANTFGNSIAGLGPKLAALDPASITKFVDALGGAQAFFNTFAYINQNFLTTAQRVALATQQLATGFDKLGLQVPQTHADFLKLLDSFDLTTEAGRTMYASVSALAPLFITVHGTADQAAQSLDKLGDAAGDAADAIIKATAEITVSVGTIVEAGKSAAEKLLDSFSQLADASTGDFGDKLGIQIDLIRDALDKAGAIQTVGGSFTLLGGTQADKVYVSELSKSYVKFAGELARFTILSAQYDAARAEQLVSLEEWYADQQKIFTGNAAALDALDVIFGQKWDAIVNGVSDGVSGTLDQLTRLKEGIANYLRGLAIGDLSVLTPQQQLDQAQASYVDTLMKAQAGDLGALGDLTKFADDYLKEAREFYKTSDPYVAIYNAVTSQLGQLAGTTPTGLPLAQDDSATLAAVLPTSGTLASSEDVKAIGEKLDTLNGAIAALADANTADSQDEQDALAAAARKIAAAGASQLK